MRYLSIIFGVLIFYLPCQSQGEADNWLFGWSVQMNFSSVPPTAQSSVFDLFGGSACMSDRNGNLLYYSDGYRVYNRLHQPMPGCLPSLAGSKAVNTNQCTLTVPYPGHDSLYFIFYIEYHGFNNYVPRLRYAIINMNAQNGLGDVQQKDVLLLNGDSICMKMTATRHCNKKDIWLIGHLKNSDKYFAYLVTRNGISATPVYSAGNMINESNRYYNHRGYMKVSPAGDKIAAGFMGDLDMVEIGDFNSQTGIINDFKKLVVKPSWALAIPGIGDTGPYGVEFSPSGRYLYVGSLYDVAWPCCNYPTGHLHQFDLSSNVESVIQSSRFLVDSVAIGYFFGMQLANNGKIYITNQNNFLHLIDDPEGTGLACGYVRKAINTGNGTLTGKDLPSFLQSYLRFPLITTGNCQFQNISFSVQNLAGVNSILWDFGDPSSGSANSSTLSTPMHIFTEEGSYLVKAILYNTNGCEPDTITKLIHAGPFKVFLGIDTTICEGDTLKLKMNIPGAVNLWSNNRIDTFINVTQSGTYWVRVKIGECFASDTIVISSQPRPVFSLGSDTTVCVNQPLLLSPDNLSPDLSYLWSTGSNSPTISVNDPGEYWLRVKDNLYGCQYYDTISVQFKSLPGYSLGQDTSLCEGNRVLLNAIVGGATGYLWNTGSSTPEISVTQSGIYWADVIKDNCTYRDSIEVIFEPLPVVNFGADTTLCEGQQLLLDAGNTGAEYLWQNNSTLQTFQVTSPGQYFVKVSKQSCSSTDTLQIRYDLAPVFTLGQDFGICEGQSVLLQPQIEGSLPVSYLWQNGSVDASFSVQIPGIYALSVSNRCGSKTDNVNVTKGVCKIYVPSAFSPNGDGRNEVFKAEYGENIVEFWMTIYNRWGQSVFQSRRISEGWDGNLGGIPQPTGVFVWMIRYKALNDARENILRGVLMLIR